MHSQSKNNSTGISEDELMQSSMRSAMSQNEAHPIDMRLGVLIYTFLHSDYIAY